MTADRMQWLLNGSVWDADRLRDAVRGYVITHLGCEDASLVIDDTQAQKKGTKSVGVAFQHCGLTGDVRNCQTMVMLTYATADGHAFIDRHLYLPEEWTNDRRRCREAGVPDEIAFATSPSSPSRCPRGPARCTCRSPGCWPTPATAVIRSFGGMPRQPAVKRADDLLHYAKTRDQWERRSCGDGAKGEQLYDWTAFAVKVKDENPADGDAHWLVLRRSLHPNRRDKDGQLHREIAYFLVHALVGTTVSEVIARAGGRWQIEEDNEINKELVSLAQYQFRKWPPGTVTSPPACWPPRSSASNAPPSPNPSRMSARSKPCPGCRGQCAPRLFTLRRHTCA
ncbi:IS701 family transposase [Streptomyces mirabilis]|uniref:transposase n=1 Tax=Streptomyces mirabilis TaxID=68239 RepID=UPI0036EB18C7